ncbi:membrane protein [Mycobacteroides abscessus subsp. abscessus]|uniref:heme-binding protein n=1 Tax=Mycobacteroides abscessus TaxID=36809 RepID=UPI0009263522|nr:membrane protein [Mycobacteroides abscessus subsp. abscessus]SLC85071.1 membrane protein [Mycobacteroides abscessus subsp. abscessus]
MLPTTLPRPAPSRWVPRTRRPIRRARRTAAPLISPASRPRPPRRILFTHPGVNESFTGLHGHPRDEVPAASKAFFDAHPQQHAELSGIRQLLVDFRARCGITAPDRLEGAAR